MNKIPQQRQQWQQRWPSCTSRRRPGQARRAAGWPSWDTAAAAAAATVVFYS